jgi:hypothetical protein
VDLTETFLKDHPEFEVRVNVVDHSHIRIHCLLGQTGLRGLDLWKDDEPLLVPLATGEQLQAAFRRVFELRLDYGLLGYEQHQLIRMQVSIWANALPLQVIPQEGWLSLRLTDEFISW